MKNGKPQWDLARWLRMLMLIAGWVPAAITVIQALNGQLGFNPVETALRRTGRTAVIFLLLSLAATPINKIFKLPAVGRLRKPLGLFAALYAGLHFAAFAIWDYQLSLGLIWAAIIEKPFIILGLFALIILAVLAGTSFRFALRQLGKKWVYLHRLVYLAAVLVILHYLLAVKGDLFSLQGNYTMPLVAAGFLILLFVLRIPWVHQKLRRLFKQEEA
jgi:sulfoxide reductase heme-binding subunit YedZ